MPRRLFSCLVVSLSWVAFAEAQMEPFQMPWNDASPGITNLQDWQTPITTGSEWVRVTTDGQYEVEGERIRFLGVNVGAASAMPTHARADAHSARLARFGFNSVRFHHLEAPWDKQNVLIDYESGTSRDLSAARLERLHYFIAQLASRGIYTNLNLLVSREFQAMDGLGPEIAQMGWKDQHILGFFNSAALDLHKEYATKLLTAPNPHRGNIPLGLDPAVAFVEIMNENGMLQKWHEGVLDSMPAVYRGQLQTRWNESLAARYASTTVLLAGWGAVDEPLGPNMLANGTFAAGAANWNTEQHAGAAATFTGTNEFNGSPSLKVTVTTAGTASWHIQVNQSALNLAAGGYYTISFWAKASGAIPLSAALSRAYGDYGAIGGNISVTLGTAWQQYTVAFQNGTAESNARINFGGFGDRLCTVWLADVRVQPGGTIGGLPDGVTLEAANVPSLLRSGSGAAYTLGQRQDWIRFLLDLETAYWNEMNQHLKTTLQYPGIVWGTIISNSPPNTQAGLDAIDSHSYWQHPIFAPGMDWDPVNWTVQNIAMTNDANGGTLGGIARQRVKGRPHNVTEYQHSSPNSYVAESPLLISAYGALQDWDGLWMFAYETTEAEHVTGYFDQGGHPGRMANNLLAASIFRRGDVAAATNEITMAFSQEREVEVATSAGGAWSVADGSHLGVPAKLSLVSRLSLDIGANPGGLTTPPTAPTGTAIASDTGELLWDNSQAGKGVVTIDTARTKAVVGFTNGRNWNLDGVRIAPGATSLDWSTVSITMLEGGSFGGGAGGRGLIVATGTIENTGQIWKDTSHTSVGANWGSAPTLIEVVPASITLPVSVNRVSAWTLNASGQRIAPLAVASDGGQAQIILGGGAATLWYEFEIAALTPPVVSTQPPSHSIAVNGSVEFSVAASGDPQPTVQWQRSTDGGTTWNDFADGGVFAGATTDTLRVIGAAVSMNGHRFRAVVTNSEGSATSNAGVLNVAATAGPRLINLSARASAGAGDNTLVLGFYIAGTGSKTLLIRAVGPELALPPYNLTGVVADPSLTVYSGSTPIASNNDWNAADAGIFAAVGAFSLTPASKDAALTLTLLPGGYTVHLVNPGPVGEGVIEVYDISRDLGTRLVNLSCRFQLNPGQNLIVGTALIGGDVPVLVRNVGPGLDPHVPLALVVPDPEMRIFTGSAQINQNDDWEIATRAYFLPTGAFDLPDGSKDAALRMVLPPGGHTVHATGKGTGGVALVELYESP
ncbi:MAG TPA: carbohydrate binding domain-containing protein [Opitutaceae bacterium]|nr:carbohydrate binding domain-containing protein [Opitutaceae bacterium]